MSVRPVAVARTVGPHPGSQAFGPEFLRGELGATQCFWIDMGAVSADAPAPHGTIYYHVPADGIVAISCLQPAVPMTLSILDAQLTRIWGEQTITLARGEARHVEAWVPGAPPK